MPNVLLAYHFLREDMTANFGNEPPWAVGESRSVAGEIIPCKSGYHGSPTLWDALTYAPGPVACLVELSGDVQPHGDPVDKYAASTRKLLAAVNIETELRLFAADCAEHVLPIYEAAYPGDGRPRRAIEAARAFARGEIDEVALDAARAAAQVAARAAQVAARAAWAAAQAAAVDAVDAQVAARAAAWAAWAAAQDAAVDAQVAAQVAARAARDAARAAWAAAQAAVVDAVDAAWTTERDWQQEQFETRFAHLFDREDTNV